MTTLFTVASIDEVNHIGDYLNLFDIPVFIIYLFPIFLVFYLIKKKKQDKFSEYKYFLSGFAVKILFGLIFTCIYLFYYKGGDTVTYFWSSRALSKLLLINPKAALSIILFDNRSYENWNSFNNGYTNFPSWNFYFHQKDSFGVVRFSSFFAFLGFNLWLPTLLLINTYLYRGTWKFFQLVCKFYPGNIKWNAIIILFVPSVLFWSSGIMKDSYTLAASLWLVTNMYYCFIERKKFLNNFLMLLFNSFILVSLKPYIFVALAPAAMIWISFLYIKNIKNKVLRLMASPALLGFGIIMGLLVLNLFKSSLGVYGDIDTMLKQAQITQQDLVRGEQYGHNYYDIGKFDPSISGIIIKAPVAIVAGLFRPFLWECRNPVMFISGIENFLFLILTLYIIFKVGIKSVYKVIAKEPLIIFSLIFSIIFAFSVGLASANFGALVRYKILAMPFFLVALFNTFYLVRKAKKEETDLINKTPRAPAL